MAENNFALIVVGIVAIVAVVGMLNFDGMTGKVDTNVIQTATQKEAYTTLHECTEGGYTCSEDWVEIGKEEGFTSDPWVCPWDETKTCYHIYYRIS